MRTHALLVSLWLAGFFAQPPQLAQPPTAPPSSSAARWPGMTEFDGEKDPASIPDHIVWRGTFLFFADIRQKGDEAIVVDLLRLGKADYEVLYKEAAKQQSRDEACEARYRRREAELIEKKALGDGADASLDEIMIDCRTQVLDAGDRVLDELSAEGRQALLAYLEHRRRSTSVLVPARDLKSFRLPR